MRIAMLTPFPRVPTAPRGGVEAGSVVLVQALAELDDLQIDVLTTDKSCTSLCKSKWNGVTIHSLPWMGGPVLYNAVGRGRCQFQDYLQRLRPDVIHAQDTFGLLVKGMRIPRVFTVRGFIHADTRLARGRFAWMRSKLWKWFEESSWADQPHIISISPYVRERLSGIARGAIYDIDNPVPADFFHSERNERKRTIFCAAHLSRLKNTLGLLRAFACLVKGGYEAKLRLAGRASDLRYEREVHSCIAANSLYNRVLFLGEINRRQICDELCQASIFVLVSLQENAPNGISEAMAVGVPVVTSNRCGMPYMVRDGETGYLVDPHDPEDIAERLRQVLENDELRVRMGSRAREIALKRFHPTVVARRTREVYLQAIQSSTAGVCGGSKQL